MRLLLLAATAALLALPAQAQNPVSYSDNTAANPDGIFNRPNSACSGATSSAYDAVAFSVLVTGNYTMDSVQGYDGYLILYRAPFDPNSPLTNCIAANDDLFPLVSGASRIVRTLSSSESYVLVTAGFGGLTGAFTNTISGPAGSAITLGGGVEVPDVDLAVTPLVSAVPATGGKARFRTTVSNNSDARVEGSVVVSVNGVERRRLSSALTSGGSQSFTVNLSFPARVPEGIYQVSFMAMSDEGEMLDMEGAFDVLVGDGERLAHPSAVLAQLKARVEAGDKAAMGELDAYLAERQAAALLVSADASASRAATVRQMKPALK